MKLYPDTVPDYLLPLIGTKFLLALASLTGAELALAFGWITDGAWSTVILGTVGAFITGNVVNTVSGIVKAKRGAE